MDIAEAKAKYGKRFCLLGNIDCEQLLPFGTEEEVEEAVKEAIAAAAPGGGYIISSSNTVHPGCKAENYVALVRAARKYGKYPL
jgi:uroporphyrinogen decarboxylase